jgi:hypothetical protein
MQARILKRAGFACTLQYPYLFRTTPIPVPVVDIQSISSESSRNQTTQQGAIALVSILKS